MHFKLFLLVIVLLAHKSHAKGLYTTAAVFHSKNPHNNISPSNNNNNFNTSVELEVLRELDNSSADCGKIKDIRERTISEFHNFFATKQLSVFQLTACYIQRINKISRFLNTVIEINPDALREALKLDYERLLRGNINGSLYGIPILIKDNIATADSMQTCSGSLALVGCKPPRDAYIVTQIKKNKGIILGKTNLSEFANFRDYSIPNGWSGRGGQTRNSYSYSRDPVGSSSGSAQAAGSNCCSFSIGTETDGSIVAPAERASLVGLKPSRNNIRIDGIIPISADTQDVVGPMTRTVEDAIIFMKSFEELGCTEDPHYKNEFHRQDEKLQFRVGVLRDHFWVSNNVTQNQKIQLLNETLVQFNVSQYITIVDPVIARNGSIQDVSGDKEFMGFLHEFKDGLNKYLQECTFPDGNGSDGNSSGTYRQSDGHMTLKDVIQYNKDHPVPEKYGQQILEMSEATDGIQNATYLKSRNENVSAARYFLNSLFEDYQLDAIAAPINDGNDDASLYGYSAIAGFPYITVPAGFINGHDPVGIVLHGPMCSDMTLLKIAQIYESIIDARRPPQFAP